jgi:hypothetical protein
MRLGILGFPRVFRFLAAMTGGFQIFSAQYALGLPCELIAKADRSDYQLRILRINLQLLP